MLHYYTFFQHGFSQSYGNYIFNLDCDHVFHNLDKAEKRKICFHKYYSFQGVKPFSKVNEYLRIFFDFGWVGLTVFLIGSLAMFLGSFMNWRKTKTELALSSVLSIVVVALMAVTDNPIVFIYVMLPVAILVATGLVARENDVSVTGNSSRGGE